MTLPNAQRAYRIAAWLLLGLGAALRLQGLFAWTITADELSALSRLYPNFRVLWNTGIAPDGHPALVQLWLWCYTRLLGDSAFLLRLPFWLCGVLSLWVAFRLMQRWFGSPAALFVLASMALSQLFIRYSCLARPYAPGLLFTLLAASYWSRIALEGDRRWHVVVALALSLVAAATTHYLSLMAAAIIAASGILVWRTDARKPLLWAYALALACFLPHLPLTLHQLSHGGVGGPQGWLAPPTPAFLREFLFFLFNDNVLVIIPFLVVGAASWYAPGITPETRTRMRLCLLWFFVPTAVAYAYSVWVNPILQHSGLLFTAPFLIGAWFCRVPQAFNPRYVLTMLVLFTASIYAFSVPMGKLFERRTFGVFTELAEEHNRDVQRCGKGMVLAIANVDGPFFLNYPHQHLGTEADYAVYHLEGTADVAALEPMLRTASMPFCSYSWSNTTPNWEVLGLIQEHYPYLIKKQWWFNSEHYLFAKQPQPDTLSWEVAFDEVCGYNGIPADFQGQPDTAGLGAERGERLHADHPYSLTFSREVRRVLPNPSCHLVANVQFRFTEPLGEASLVMEVKRGDSLLVWENRPLGIFGRDTALHRAWGWWRMPERVRAGDVLRVYVWNNGGKPLILSRMQVQGRAGNPGLYGPAPNWQP